MEVMNLNVNVTKDLTEKDAKMGVHWNVELMQVVNLNSTVLPVSKNRNAFVLITSQVEIIIPILIFINSSFIGPQCNLPICSKFECGSLTCNNETCEIRLCDTDVPSDINEICNGQTCQCSQESGKARNACNGNPCQNGGTCSTNFSANFEVCFIRNIKNFSFYKSYHIETS